MKLVEKVEYGKVNFGAVFRLVLTGGVLIWGCFKVGYEGILLFFGFALGAVFMVNITDIRKKKIFFEEVKTK